MAREEHKEAIQSYIDAYNSFDIEAMVALVHRQVVFKNIAAGKVTAEVIGSDQFRELALQSINAFKRS